MTEESLASLLSFEPEPVRPVDPPHFLVVGEYDEDDEDHFEVEHHPDCPTEVSDWGGGQSFTSYTCAVGYEIDMVGIHTFFKHEGDRTVEQWHQRESVAVGRHQIEHWVETYHSYWHGPEFDSGLRLVEQ